MRHEPSKEEKQAARVLCCERMGGMCEMRLSPRCQVGPLPLEGHLMQRGHLSHAHGKQRFGWAESEHQRHIWACYECHSWQHQHGWSGQKAVPSKK